MTEKQSIQSLLDEAAAAVQQGAHATVAERLSEVVDRGAAEGVPIPKASFAMLGRALANTGRHAEAEARFRQGLAVMPQDFWLNHYLGLLLLPLRRHGEALAAFEQAAQADPNNAAPWLELGNLHLLAGHGGQAVQANQRLVDLTPQVGEHQRLLALSHRMTGSLEQALQHFQRARELDAHNGQAWYDNAALLRDMGRFDDALALIDAGLATVADRNSLETAKSQVLRIAGRVDQAVDYLQGVIRQHPQKAWAHNQLGHALALSDRSAANTHFRSACDIEPGNLEYVVALAHSLQRTRTGNEGANLEDAYQLALRATQLRGDFQRHARLLMDVLERCGNHALAARVGDFDALGRFWAVNNQPGAFLHQLPRVKTPQDRRHLVEHHRLWGQAIATLAARSPLQRPPHTRPRGKVRIGFMSSDLRDHPVSYFLMPLLEGYDKARFEVYCYSWATLPPDAVAQHIAGIVNAFRHAPGLSSRDAAQLIANDQLDMLIELGGTTDMNKLDVMAWKPAPLQASWMGYPHSSGLHSIDYLVLDPYLKPPDPALLIEQPLELAHAWITLGRLAFDERHAITPGTPQQRNGHVTFGTMNNPYKYRPETLAAWAEVVRRTPGSRFVFVRPEGGAPSFCDNMRRAFEAGGVSGDRVAFIPVRGAHMQHYNAIDIALDTFPQTGGTTTCECLWMGVPVVTLVGEAVFERLSYSVLMNAELGELCAFTRDDYVARAVALAQDMPRRQAWRGGLRGQLASLPLGNNAQFVEDFQQAVARAVSTAGI